MVTEPLEDQLMIARMVAGKPDCRGSGEAKRWFLGFAAARAAAVVPAWDSLRVTLTKWTARIVF